MRYERITDSIGIELPDFDATRPASLEEQAELRALFCEYHMILIRGQQPSDDDQDRFMQYFGPLSLMNGGPGAYVSNLGKPGMSATGQKELVWHTDGTQGEHPGIGTSLLAIEAAPGCAPTNFISAVRAARDLPPELRARLEGLKAVHCRDYQNNRTDVRIRAEDVDPQAPEGRYQSWVHPIIYQLPHSDKQALFVNALSVTHVIGMPKDEGEALIQDLFRRLYAKEHIYTHHWQPGDLLIWDNIALQHCRPSLGGPRRHLRRLSLDGWNTGNGVMDWFAGGTPRDRALSKHANSVKY